MLGSINQIFHDQSLYGNFLTSLPEKAWEETTTDDLVFYPKLEEDWEPQYGLFWKSGMHVAERHPNGNIKTLKIATYFLPAGCVEWALRRTCGSLCTVALCLTAAPLGFAIKVIHQNVLNLSK